LPRLILRLEPLPAAAPEQGPAEPEARQPTRAEQIGAALDAANHSAPDPHVAHSNGTSQHQAAADELEPGIALLPIPTPDPWTVRRVVDVAAPERLTVATPLTRWSAAVAAAHDPCFVVDANGILISISVAAVELLGCGETAIIGRHVLDILALVDLDSGAPQPEYADRITPLAVLDNPGLSRSLIRVRHADGALVTLDTSSAPVHDVTGYPLGSVTFLAPIRSR
jgi:PAS domain S-box-containing protein